MSLSANVQEKANLIWAIADKLVGPFEPHEYGEVILPFVVIKRFDCILADTKDKVLEEHKAVQGLDNKELMDVRLKKASGVQFYNISPFTFEKLLDAPNNIASNFKAYLAGFSENVQNIIEKFDFDKQLARLVDKDLLYIIIQEFCSPKADLHPDKISNLEMGYIFEEIIRRFSEAHNGAAGQHYTPREVIRLMVNILFDSDDEILTDTTVKTMYDPTVGTGGMLSVASEYLKEMNPDAKLLCYGQEINDKTFAICKADMLIKGENADNIKNGNTLADDKFEDSKFSYILSNPPFGIEWKKEKAAVEAEAKLGFAGRFGAGLPPVSDSQMLFLQICINKLNPDKGKACVIQNGSPLFSGDAGSGQSEIRRYLLEHDYLDAIIGLPNNIFYNTGIATYIWVLSTKKPAQRKGKVILINASEMYEKRRKALGDKRHDIPESAIAEITRVYSEFKETEISKIFNTDEFGYRKVVVERPMRDENGDVVLKKGKPVADPKLRDTENIPLTEDIQSYFAREVLPFAPDAWIDESKTKIGYEIPFTRYFYKYTPPRKSEDIMADIIKQQQALAKYNDIYKNFAKVFEPYRKISQMNEVISTAANTMNSVYGQTVAQLTKNQIANNLQRLSLPVFIFHNPLFDSWNRLSQTFQKYTTPVSQQMHNWLSQLNIAANGWALPIDREDFRAVCPSCDEEDIVATFEQNDGKILRDMQQVVIESIHHTTPKNLFIEAVKCYNTQMYHACVYSLVPIIDGLIHNPTNPTSTQLIKSFEKMTDKLRNGLIRDPRVRICIILKEYIDWCYGIDVPFDDEEPENVNRHWAAHCKYKDKEMTKTDCMQLFCAIYMMAKVASFCAQIEVEE